MDRGPITPGCYYHTTTELAESHISVHDFFSKTLKHLGPTSARVCHPEDVNPVDHRLGHLSWAGKFGLVAAAINLCESDALAESVDVEELVPLFVACTSASQTLESIKALDSQNVLKSPLFRQALIVTALKSGNDSLTQALIKHIPTTPPPPESCVFRLNISPIGLGNISAGVLTALVTAGWALPSREMALSASTSRNGPDGVALLNAIIAAGLDMHDSLLGKTKLTSLALIYSEPEVLKRLFEIYSVVPNDDMLIQAVELRNEGGVEVLRWLLDTYGLDVNYVRQGRSPFEVHPGADPRERAEREYEMQQTGIRPKNPRTALHATKIRGNTEAYNFLLSRGALDDAGDEP